MKNNGFIQNFRSEQGPTNPNLVLFFAKMKKLNVLAGELQITKTTLKYHEIKKTLFCQFLSKALEYVKLKTTEKLDFRPF